MKTLKNKIIAGLSVVALLFAFSFNANAQDADPQNTGPANSGQPQIEIGAKGLLAFSSFRMMTSTGTEVKGVGVLGYGLSAMVGFNFNSHVELQAEVMYSSISRKYSEADVDRQVNLRYVNIPLLFSLNTGKFRAVNLNIVVGPQLGILVGNTVYTSGNTTTDTPIAVLTVRKSDIGLAYGAGLDFGLNRAGTIRVGTGFRGTYGLFNISNRSGTTTTEEYYVLDKVHLQTYSIYAGFSFLF